MWTSQWANRVPSAEAVSAVHLRLGWVCEEIKASPKSMSVSDKPMASDVPPLTPANTSMSEPPKVSTSAMTVSAGSEDDFLASVKVSAVLLTARLPVTCTKP